MEIWLVMFKIYRMGISIGPHQKPDYAAMVGFTSTFKSLPPKWEI